VVASQEGVVASYALATSQTLWQWPSGTPEAEILTTPVATEQHIFVIQMNGQVHALASENGAEVWSFVPPQPE
jgi:hypothetical protein